MEAKVTKHKGLGKLEIMPNAKKRERINMRVLSPARKKKKEAAVLNISDAQIVDFYDLKHIKIMRKAQVFLFFINASSILSLMPLLIFFFVIDMVKYQKYIYNGSYVIIFFLLLFLANEMIQFFSYIKYKKNG